MPVDEIEIPDGQIITETGAYRMSMDWYHSQCAAGPSISSTGLRTIYHESPADFWAFSDLNDFRFEKEASPAFTYGRAAHALLLGDEDFEASFIVLPKVAPPKPTAAQISARAQGRVSDAAAERFEFWDDFDARAAGREILTMTDLIHIEHLADRLREHELLPILMEGAREQSLIWQDEKTGIWLKSRLDIQSATGDFADLKTTRHRRLDLIMRDIRQHGYDMQVALQTMGIEAVHGIPFTPESYAGRACIDIFVHKEPPYHIIPVELSFDALVWARRKIRAAIDTMKECIDTDIWPGPVEGIPVYTPDFELQTLEAKVEAGLLPFDA